MRHSGGFSVSNDRFFKKFPDARRNLTPKDCLINSNCTVQPAVFGCRHTKCFVKSFTKIKDIGETAGCGYIADGLVCARQYITSEVQLKADYIFFWGNAVIS